MLDWFRRLRRASRKLVLPSRDAAETRSQAQLNYAKLTFSREDLIAQLSVSQVGLGEQLIELAKLAPLPALSESLKAQGEDLVESASRLALVLNRIHPNSKELLAEHQVVVDELIERSYAPAWHERLIAYQVVFGFVFDTLDKLVKAQPTAFRSEVKDARGAQLDADLIGDLLLGEITRISGLSHRLALFARSVVGDALLAVRDLVNYRALLEESPSKDAAEANRQAFKVLEPLTSELIGLHSQRMERLGLIA